MPKPSRASKIWAYRRFKNPNAIKSVGGEFTLTQQRFLRSLGLEWESIRALEKPENYKCAICGSKQNLVIYHCHESGDFRDLLCYRCNNGLGQFKDNPKLLFTAFMYLRKHHR